MKSFFRGAILFLISLPAIAQEHSPVDQKESKGEQIRKDSLISEREGLTVHFYRNGERLSSGKIKNLYQENPSSLKLFNWSTPMKITAGVMGVGGVALGVIALKGNPQSVEIDNKTYHYVTRSKPQLIGGLALLAGGICLFEWSNDMLVKSANKYNLRLKNKGKRNVSLENLKIDVRSNGMAVSLAF